MNNFLFMIVFAALIMKQKIIYKYKIIKELLFLINRRREKANMVQNGFQKKAICI